MSQVGVSGELAGVPPFYASGVGLGEGSQAAPPSPDNAAAILAGWPRPFGRDQTPPAELGEGQSAVHASAGTGQHAARGADCLEGLTHPEMEFTGGEVGSNFLGLGQGENSQPGSAFFCSGLPPEGDALPLQFSRRLGVDR